MKYRDSSWTSANRSVASYAIASLLVVTQAGNAWAIVDPPSDELTYPQVISDTGPGSNPRVIRTLLESNKEEKWTSWTFRNEDDERDAMGIGAVWNASESDERYELLESNGAGQTTLTAIDGEKWFSYFQTDYSTGSFISHRENETTGEAYVMDIQGAVNPFVAGTYKLWGTTELYECNTDETTGVDTYTKDLSHDTLFPGRKDGYEHWQFETTEGIEWILTEYWMGFSEAPPNEFGPQSRTTSGIEEYSAGNADDATPDASATEGESDVEADSSLCP